MRYLCASFVLLGYAAFGATLLAGPSTEILNRNPAKPAWEIDITDRLANTESRSAPATGLSIQEFFGHKHQEQMLPKPNQTFWWRAALPAMPAGAEAGWPVVLEWDESRLVNEVWVNGQKLAKPEIVRAKAWVGGEGVTVVPVAALSGNATLDFRAGWLTQLYENGFGRVRLRPAELFEAVDVERGEQSVELKNRSDLPLNLAVDFTVEDFFEVPLAKVQVPVALGASASQRVDWPEAVKAAAQSADYYKVRVTVRSGNRVSPEYWVYTPKVVDNRNRREVLPLATGWEWVPAPGQLGNRPPADGWKFSDRPQVPPTEWKTHNVWMRRSVTVPADWKNTAAQLYLNSVVANAKIYINGTFVAEVAQWQTPAWIPLPPVVKPGAKVDLTVGLTDFIVGLRPGLEVPPDGVNNAPGDRALAAPIAEDEPKLVNVELIGLPAARVESAIVRTKGTNVTAALTLRNDFGALLQVSPVVSVLDAGKVIARQVLPAVNLQPRSQQTVVTPSLAVPGAQLWTTETPHLYEYRIELVNAARKVVDQLRERFGFREFGIRDDYFVLNGERVNLWGNSHSVHYAGIDNNLWPAAISANRFPRMYAGSPKLQMCDESGMLVKLELAPHNALHRDRYAYHEPVMWERVNEQMQRLIQPYKNHPSIVMIDVGNELWFSRDGEGKSMVDTYNRFERMDPTRVATNSGGYPNMLPGARVIDWHGWPSFKDRTDWFFFHPEERPSYAKDQGFFAHRPTGESPEKWTVLSEGAIPKEPTKLFAVENKPILFSEGHYYESSFQPGLNGISAWVPIPEYPGQTSFDRQLATHALNWIGSRRQTVQSARLAGFPGNIIHVDRGIGRWVLPLAAAPLDRRFRFYDGEPMQTTLRVFCDLAGKRKVRATVTLFDGAQEIGRKEVSDDLSGGQYLDVPVDFPLPAATTDKDYRLNLQVTAEGYPGYFRDDYEITAFARPSMILPEGQTLTLFDPVGKVAAFLEKQGVSFTRIASLSDWKTKPNDTLMIGSEGLNRTANSELPHLRDQVAAGGRVIVLDHRTLPAFLKRRIVQRTSASGLGISPGTSVITRGLLGRDFKFWNTTDRDWISEWGSLELPSTGLTRTYVELPGNENKTSAAVVLEVAEGAGRVVFCQLNLQTALGVEPAADRVLANLLRWTAEPSPFAEPKAAEQTLIVAADARRLSILRDRVGLEGVVAAQPTAEQIQAAQLIILDGAPEAAVAKLDAAAFRQALEKGATVLVLNPSAKAMPWVSQLAGETLGLEDFPQSRAHLLGQNPLTAGLTHGSFYIGPNPGIGSALDMDTDRPTAALPDSLAYQRITGNTIRPLLQPAFLAEVPVGKGRLVISTMRSLDYPVTKPLYLLSNLLMNAGARLTAGGIISKDAEAPQKWSFTPVSLERFVNWPLADDPNGRRGFHMQGSENDLRAFPRGRQTLHGVDYDLVDPDKLGGNGTIALAGRGQEGRHPAQVKSIPVGRKADRLYFLHNSAWGRPGFVYRVYYTEDRRKWIPGQPDPFVDVVVNPKENIADVWGADAYEKGEAFLSGATVAWSDANAYQRSRDTRVGVYQMVWDNPYPEKEIESIDIISPQQVGGGQIFVYGITAASRDESAATTKPPLSKVLPAGISEDRVFTQWQNNRYGIVMLKNGSIPVVYDRQGQPLITLPSGAGADAPPSNIQVEALADGSRVFTLTDGKTPDFTWSQKWICRDSSVRVEWTWVPTSSQEKPPSLGLHLKVLAKATERFDRWGVNPLDILTEQGTLSVGWEPRLSHWFKAYWVREGTITFVPFYEKAWVAGQPITFWVELGI